MIANRKRQKLEHWLHNDLESTLILWCSGYILNLLNQNFCAWNPSISVFQKQTTCPQTKEWIKKMWYTYTVKYYSVTNKEWNNVICNNLDGPRDYHTKWSKSDRERQISYDITYMWTLKKWCKSTYLQSRNRLIDIASEFMITKGERGGGIN